MGNKKKKKDKLKDLDHDSISEITDLSQEGILTTSMDKLSLVERRNLKEFVNQMRLAQYTNPADHDCKSKPAPGKTKLNNACIPLVEM